MSDFHEMATNLRRRTERFLLIENAAYGVDKGGRRLGIERRQFHYSHYCPERRIGFDRRVIPERRADQEPGA